jgi:hypothetical protein
MPTPGILTVQKNRFEGLEETAANQCRPQDGIAREKRSF